MRINKPIPDREYLLSILDYNPDSGDLTWKRRDNQRPQWNARYEGKVAGCHQKTISGKTYINIIIDGEKYLAHRIAWKISTGDEPEEIDHIDGNGENNSLSNLRASNRKLNHRNKRLPKSNTSGCIGVSRRGGRTKWRADIKVSGVTIALGSFSRFEDAVHARMVAEKKYGFHDEHGSKRSL